MTKGWSVKVVLLSLFLVLALVGSVGAEDKPPSGGIIPKLPTTANDPELVDGRVYPFWGPVCQRYTYSVVYRDKEGRPPEYVKIYFNGQMIDMDKENSGASDYKNGVKYVFKNVPKKLGANFYYFEASNGLGKARDSIIDSPDNGPVLFESAFDKNEIAVINKASGKKVLSYPTGKEWIGGVALSDDGKYLATQTSYRVLLFDTSRPEKPVWEYKPGIAGMIGGDVKGGVDISGDGSRIVAALGSSVFMFGRESNKPIWQHDVGDSSYNVAISKDGKYAGAATAGEESDVGSNLLVLWSEKSSEPLWQYHSSGNFHDVSLSDDGSYIAGATGCPDRRAYIFSRDSNKPIIRSEMLTRDSPVHRAKISADGTRIAVGSESDGGAVFMFTKDSKAPLWRFPIPQSGSVRALNFTPDGQYIGATTLIGNAYIFSKDSNRPISSWEIAGTALGAMDIADDGGFIAVGGTDNMVHILDKDSRKDTRVSFDEYIQEIDISGNGQLIAAGTGGSVYFFETFSGNENKVFSCQDIIEPSPESSREQRGMGGAISRDEKRGGIPWLPILLGFVFLLTALGLGGYWLYAKTKQLVVNRRVFIVLSVLVVISLALIASFMVFDRLRPAGRAGGVCGDGLCEELSGEDKENCPQDPGAGSGAV